MKKNSELGRVVETVNSQMGNLVLVALAHSILTFVLGLQRSPHARHLSVQMACLSVSHSMLYKYHHCLPCLAKGSTSLNFPEAILSARDSEACATVREKGTETWIRVQRGA